MPLQDGSVRQEYELPLVLSRTKWAAAGSRRSRVPVTAVDSEVAWPGVRGGHAGWGHGVGARSGRRNDDGDRSPHRLSWVTRLQRPRQSAYAAIAKRSSLAFTDLRGLRPSPFGLPAHLCPPCRDQFTPTEAHRYVLGWR